MEKNDPFVIDSSFLIAFYDYNDTDHAKALATAKEYINRTVYLHPYIIQEVITILTYRFGSTGSYEFIENFLNSKDTTIYSGFDVIEEIDFFKRINKRISFADSALIHMAKREKVPILTYDKQMMSILRNMK